MNVFLGLWAQLFQENLGTCRLAIKLEGTQLMSLVSVNYDFQIFYFLTLLGCNAVRKNSVNHKNKQLPVVYFQGMGIVFLELDRFVLKDLVLAASLALMTSQRKENAKDMIKLRLFTDNRNSSHTQKPTTIPIPLVKRSSYFAFGGKIVFFLC